MDKPEHKTNQKHLPGNEAFWFVIAGYQLAFGAFFVIYAYYKILSRAEYAQFQEQLSQGLGFVNTLILLTSSWFAVAAIKAMRKDQFELAKKLLWFAVGCGVLFTLIKMVEYQKSLNAGYSLLTNEFFTFYYLLTGLHLMHVWIGIGGLIIATILLKKQPLTDVNEQNIECCAAFWHMVDYLWIFIFPLLYLMQ